MPSVLPWSLKSFGVGRAEGREAAQRWEPRVGPSAGTRAVQKKDAIMEPLQKWVLLGA